MLKLIQEKHRLLMILLVILAVFYFFIPLSLTFFPSWVLKKTLIFGLPFLWLYTFLQLPITWLMAWYYSYRAKKFEASIAALKSEAQMR